jgi:DNA-directed RNA polymerase subunit RPC12/RpoP
MGVYVCPRCGSGETYSSEENGRTIALTLDAPGPVDPTLFRTMKETVTRCKKCGEKTAYIPSKEDRLKNMQSAVKQSWSSFGFFGVTGILVLSIPLFTNGEPWLTNGELSEITSWIGIIFLALSAFSLLLVPLLKVQIKELNRHR